MMRLRVYVSAVLVALLVSGCTHLGSLDKAVYEITAQIVTATEQLRARDLITQPQFAQASVYEHDVAVAGSTFNALLRAGHTEPSNALPLLRAVRKAVHDLQAMSIGVLGTVLQKLAELDTLVSDFAGKVLAATVPAGGA